jgi:hypothetical protein
MASDSLAMPGYRYRLHDQDCNDLGVIVHPVPNLEPGDAITLSDGSAFVVTARLETRPEASIKALLMLARVARHVHCRARP